MGQIHTSARVHRRTFRSSMTFQSYERLRSNSRYGNLIRSRSTLKNSVISSPPMLRDILLRHKSTILHQMISFGYLVSDNTRPSSTQAILVFIAPISTTQALEIPAPYVAASDSYCN